MGGDAGMKINSRLVAAFTAAAVTCMAGTAFAGVTSPDKVKIEDKKVKASLTGKDGNAADGRKWFANRKLGNCLACHVNKDMPDKPFHGEIGPPIDGVAGRLSASELRAVLVNAKAVNGEDTIMPSFYRVKNGARTAKKFQGKTILSGQQVEDIIAYLLTLKE